VFAGIGVGIATWHVRLQMMPADEVPSCGPGFEYIMDNFALFDALGMIFKGSGECAEVVWSLLGLSMPSWVIIAKIIQVIAAPVTTHLSRSDNLR
jgi:disulfide bond formation protein DsbB